MRMLQPKAKVVGDPLSDCSSLISAAAAGKLRLVRLLVEGGVQVNGCNARGETALLAVCKALRGEPTGPDTLKLLTYLLQNKDVLSSVNEADPNAQDRTGRTALMYACMERAGPQVASALLSAGADPSMEDHSGASALVYAVNTKHQQTLKVLMDACRARGRDIVIISTETGVSGGPMSSRYLSLPPSPDTSPVSCMSPSDIVLRTGSTSTSGGENIFNFRGAIIGGRRASCEWSPTPPRQRVLSEPWLTAHDPARRSRAYQEGTRVRGRQEEGDCEDLTGDRRDEDEEDEGSPFHQPGMEERRDNRHGGGNYSGYEGDFFPWLCQSVLSLPEMCSSQAAQSRAAPRRGLPPGGSASHKMTLNSSAEKLPAVPSPHSQLRRNTLPSVMVAPPLIHLPPLVHQSSSHLQVPEYAPPFKSRSMVFLPHPPSSPPPSSAARRIKAAVRPPLPHITSSGERSCGTLRRHSVQLEHIRGQTRPLDLGD